jgi:hypothetical protein
VVVFSTNRPSGSDARRLFFVQTPICKRPQSASHILYLRIGFFSACGSKSPAVLCGEDFGIFSLDIHLTLFKKKAVNGGI